MNDLQRTRKKAARSIAGIIALAVMLTLTSLALVLSFVAVEDNIFQNATVQIELNGGRPVFDGSDMNVEPGAALKRDFTIQNTGTADVYYRLYLENVEGALQKALRFEVYDGERQLFSGTADEWNSQTPCVGDAPLLVGETRTLTMLIKMEETAGNAFQNASIAFDITADAVQVRNNPDKVFE